MSKARDNVEVLNNPMFSFKNKIINGGFDVWQRGTSQTTNGYGSVDRWNNSVQGTSPIKTTSMQDFTLGQTEVTGNPKHYIRTDITTAGTEIGDYVAQWQAIEGVSTLSGETATLSFWAKADAPAYMSIELEQSFGTGGSPSPTVFNIATQKLSLTTSWQKFTITTTVPSISGKTLGTDGNDCLYIVFWFDAGSSYDSNTNSLGHQTGIFDIAQVQLEAGSVATEFERRPLSIEEMLCYRYYKCYNSTIVQGGRVKASQTECKLSTCVVFREPPTVLYSFCKVYSGFSLSVTNIVSDIDGMLYLTHIDSGESTGTAAAVYITGCELDAEL